MYGCHAPAQLSRMISREAAGREPAINMPALLTGTIVVLLAIHAVRGWLDDTTDMRLLLDYAFLPARWSTAFGLADAEAVVRAARESVDDPAMAAARQALAVYVLEETTLSPWSIVTYGFLHGSWMHVILNCVWLAAFGTPVVRRFGTGRSLFLAAATALGGSLAFWLVHPLSVQIVIGASGIVSGFMGAASVFVFGPPEHPYRPPLRGFAALAALGRNGRALLFLLVWFAINLVVGLLGAPLGLADGGIAWEAHIGGLLAGLLAFPLLDPVRARAPHSERLGGG